MMQSPTLLKKAAVVAAVLSCSILSAQYAWDIGFSAGASNYLGDMGGNVLSRRDFVSDMKISQPRMNAGGFVRYKMNPWFAIKTNLTWIRVSGDDKLSSNPGRNGRNLNFRNDMVELGAQIQFTYYQIHNLGRSYRHHDNFKAYVGLGAGMVYHNPKTLYQGVYIPLRPLTTEGDEYSRIAAVIPVSGGFYFTFDKKYRIGFDLSWRTTFTDYLDDVSTTYADPSELPSALAIDLANRTDELNTITPAFAENFTPGNKRGDPSHNDSYLTSSVEFSYAIRGRSVAGGDKPIYHWLKRRNNHPSKYDGNGRVRHRVRKIRLKW